MRLLKREKSGWFATSYTFSLVECNARDPPLYAILSHRWGPDEVTYQDIQKGTAKSRLGGYKKLEFCAEQAACDGLVYFWVDTCCIDKSSSAELSEAINSMFRWYQNATKCYVYLADVSTQQDLGSSVWFSRGWTLQELIAPRIAEFFSAKGRKLGNKKSLEREICEITGISVEAMQGKPLAQIAEQERFSWTIRRETTIDEDGVYCLLGIFGVHMPLLYGEGYQNALVRLRREIHLLNSPIAANPQPQKHRDNDEGFEHSMPCTPNSDKSRVAFRLDSPEPDRPRSDLSEPGLPKPDFPRPDPAAERSEEETPEEEYVEHQHLSTSNTRMLSSESLGRHVSFAGQDGRSSKKLPRTGLTNVGLNCYMNSILQCLSATLPLSSLLMDESALKREIQANSKGSSGIMPSVLANIIRALWKNDVDTVKPTTFRNLCSRFNDGQWCSNQKQSAKEFFDFLINCLHEDLNVFWECTQLQPLTSEQISSREKYEIADVALVEWQRYAHTNFSSISIFFAGQHALRYKCASCNRTSTTYETFYSISITAPLHPTLRSQSMDIDYCLDLHTKKKKFGFGERWTCPNCEIGQGGTKQIILTQLPRFLVIHIERLGHGDERKSNWKTTTPIEFPLQGLNLDRYVRSPANQTENGKPPSKTLSASRMRSLYESTTPPFSYDCYAVIQLKGNSIENGHYVSLVKDQGRKCWRKFDDDRYHDFDPEQLIARDRLQNGDSYMLFFQRDMSKAGS